MIEHARTMIGLATQGQPIAREMLERFMGRLVNLSQIMPEVKRPMAAGFQAERAFIGRAGHRHRPKSVTLKKGGPLALSFVEMLDVVISILEANEGVPLMPRSCFPGLRERGTLTIVTDASGEDGVGGYAFLSHKPKWVGVMFEEWPKEILSALQFAKERKLQRQGEMPALSMPAAELFGSAAMAELARQRWPGEVRAVIAVSDCDAAVAVVNATTSRSAQMRTLIGQARVGLGHWLGVSVPRESNQDADRLSHPADGGAVMIEASEAGLWPERLRIPAGVGQGLGRGLGQAAHLGVGAGLATSAGEDDACGFV